tara:strand:- start:14745 stop:15317 length:573 start_codon:yes stop_codon:yes gene_type:complete
MRDKQHTEIKRNSLTLSELPNLNPIKMKNSTTTTGYHFTYKKYDVQITRLFWGGNKEGDWAVDVFRPNGYRLSSKCLATTDDCESFAKDQVEDHINSMIDPDMIDSIVWYGLNYNPNFIDECWSDDPSLANHLKDKFAMCHEGTDELKGWVKIRLSYGVFTRFLTMLDNGNREKLYKYILERYSHRKGWL